MNLSFCLFVCLPMLAYSSLFESPVGPYWLTFKSFEKCPKQGSNEIIHDFHLRKTNRTTVVIYGDLHFKRDMDDGIKMKNELSVLGNGGWRPNAYHLDFDRNICKTMIKFVGKDYVQFWSNAGVNITKTNCVIPANKYKVDGIVVSNWYFKLLPMMAFGLYRITTSFYSAHDELLGCLRLVVEISRQ